MPTRIACLLLLACCTANAFSQGSALSPGATPSAEPMRIVFMTADVWPWGYHDAQGQPSGLLSDFIQRLAQKSGVPLDNRILPYQRLLAEFKHGRGDYTVVFENPEFAGLADSLGQVLISDILLVANPDFVGDLTLGALAGKRVGYISGTYYGEAFQRDEQLIKIAVYNLDQAIEMLRINRLDAVISSDIVLYHSLLALDLRPDTFRYVTHISDQPAHLYISGRAANHPLANRLQAALANMHESGELRTLFYSPLRASANPLQPDE